MNDSIQSYKSKFVQIGISLALLLLSLVGLKMLMFGSYSLIGLIIVLCIGTATILLLDRYYWVLAPVLFLMPFSIPGVPFDGAELGCLELVVVHAIRACLRKEPTVCFSRELLPALPFAIWAFFVFLLNPVGIGRFGSAAIGGRFYIKILLGFLALVSLSTLRFSEFDCKVLIRSIFVASLLFFILRIILPEPEMPFVRFDPFAETNARYQFIAAMYPYGIVMAMCSLPLILKSPKLLVFTLACAACVLYSGKRESFLFLFLVPVYRVLLTRRNLLVTVAVCFIALLGLGFLAAGDGTTYHLPKTITRCLSIVFPQYRKPNGLDSVDYFRSKMREQAELVIRENPWFGRKGFRMSREEAFWMMSAASRGGEMFAEHAYAGNWHSTWYGMCADFGIPAGVFWALFYLSMIRCLFHSGKHLEFNSYRMSCYLWCSFLLLEYVLVSYFNGHSATTPLHAWFWYGIVLALLNSPNEGAKRIGYESPSCG